MTDVSTPLPTCAWDGCQSLGVFPVDRELPDGDTVTVIYCFEHSGPAPAAADTAADEAPTFHTDVTAGLAAMVLEHTAMTVLDTPDAAGDAMRSFAANTGMTLDVAAGVLLATSWIMAAGQVSEEMLLRGAELLERQAEIDDADDQAADTAGTDGPLTSDETPPGRPESRPELPAGMSTPLDGYSAVQVLYPADDDADPWFTWVCLACDEWGVSRSEADVLDAAHTHDATHPLDEGDESATPETTKETTDHD